MVQLPAAATETQSLPVTLKSVLPVSSVTLAEKVELLVQVKVWVALANPTGAEPKDCVAGVRVAEPPSFDARSRRRPLAQEPAFHS